jgi:hypothetical protein
MKRFLLAALIIAAAACGGRPHLEPAFGRSNHDQFAAQWTPPPPGAKRVVAQQGLDSQEAGIIARSYRRGLAPKDTTKEAEPVLLVAPPQAQGYREALPPPSVPKE